MDKALDLVVVYPALEGLCGGHFCMILGINKSSWGIYSEILM